MHVGAGLLAKADCQPTCALTVKSLSRASPLPQILYFGRPALSMQALKICVKNAAPPENGRRKRSQGGVQFPTGGNCAQCA